MALANPALNPPRLPSPTKRGFHLPSPPRSPSPVRHDARYSDPLLGRLSPTATLRAFAVQSPDAEPDFLSKSVEAASSSERALGVKAAQACADVRSWARELEQWQWPGTFDVPESVRKKQRLSGASLLSMRPASPDSAKVDEEFWGSLPAQMVQAYGNRVEEVNEDLDEIDVEELKDYVLSAHQQARIGEASIDDSIGTIGAATDMGKLDDFTALVTATILQALPYLSRLTRFLHTWTVRLGILRATPAYLRDLRQARTDLDHGWAALAVSPNPASTKFTLETMNEMKGVILEQVQSLGRRLDRFLDELEGREETVPDAWIDDFETLEQSYGEWVVRAETKVHENEWRRAKMQEEEQRQKTQLGESLLSDDGGLIGRTLSKMTVESRELPHDQNVVVKPESAPKSSQPPTNNLGRTAETLGTKEDGQDAPSRATSKSVSPSKRSRHTPITIDFDETGRKVASEENLTALPTNPKLVTPIDASPATDLESKSEAGPDVKKRAAFLNRDIETSNQLNRSKPPPIVRPFEHASNAFTRLFKRDSRAGSSGDAATDSEREISTSRRRSFGRRRSKDRVTSNKENIRPTADKQINGNQSPISLPRKSGEMARRLSRTTSGDGMRSLTESSKFDKRVYADLVVPPVRWPEDVREPEEDRRSRPRTPKNIVPATYQPTRLESPFREEDNAGQDFEFPQNWPLSGSATPQQDAQSPINESRDDEIARSFGPVIQRGPASENSVRRHTMRSGDDDYDELRLHKSAPDTNALEDLFVQSLPNSPTNSRPGSRKSAKSLHRSHASKDSATTKSSMFTLEELKKRSMEIDRYQKRDAASDALRKGITTVEEEQEHTFTEPRTPPQSPSQYRVADVAVFGSSLRSPNRGSRISRSSMLATSPALAQLQIPDGGKEISEATLLQDVASGIPFPEIARRASGQSVESGSPPGADDVNITPQSPTSPNNGMVSPVDSTTPSGPHTPVDRSSSPVSERSSPKESLEREDTFGFPSPPSVPLRTTSLSASPGSGRRSARRRPSLNGPSPPLTDDYDAAATPLGKMQSKRKYKDVPSLSHPEASTVASAARSKPSHLRTSGDNFDRHVSDVLDRVQAPIRFKSRPGAETPQPESARPEVGSKAKSYSRLQAPKPVSAKSMTLAPAATTPHKGPNTSEPEVKLYHLTQAGRTEPIKLFVRLVGEGERVMVRVGGGWADLTDYLRQYADHHGSRTVSEGTLEVSTAAGANPATGARRTFSTPAPPATEPIQATSARATPSPAPLDLSSTATGAGADVEEGIDGPSWLKDPLPRFTMGDSDSSDFTNTPAMPTFPRLSGSRPGTANGGSAELPDSERKARWVEGMIAKAKESAEKSDKFTDLGKVGGTRRVVFREK